MAYIELLGIEKRYGAVQAVSDFNLSIEKGEMVALLGPSGCGKTTTLRMLAGFVPVSAGTLRLDGRDITSVPPYQRNIGMVFQGYALFPHMTVAKNVAFGLRMRRLPQTQIAPRVAEALGRVRLQPHSDRFPRELSGGQQQRVALARAMAINPDVLLLDEPLSALDARLRQEVREEIRELQLTLGLTTVIVTHDQDEALSMADRMVVMNKGGVEQIGTPTALYERPCNRFVAEFLGKSNFLHGHVESPGVFRSTDGKALGFAPDQEPAGATCLSFRPERTTLLPSTGDTSASFDGANNFVTGKLVLRTYLGHVIEYKATLPGGETVIVLQANTDGVALEVGSTVRVTWAARDSRLLA
jgi:putative spermidine/putrescine transport system ATP-binding protein